MSACGTANADALVRSVVAVAECQATALARDGWQGFSGSGLFAGLLTGLLTLAVAREGYRLLASGGAVDPARAASVLLRFGIVIALTTSWAAYDRLVFRVAMEGPAEIAGAIFPSAGIDTARLATRLANAHDAIATAPPPVDTTAPGTNSAAAQNPETRPPATDDGLPGSGRRAAAGILLVSGAGSWIAARFALAFLLAVAPLAFVALLFEVSSGLFLGWLRAFAGAALAGLVLPMSLALELQMIEGPVTAAAQAGSAAIPGLGSVVWIFALVNVALIFAVQRMAGGLKLPARMTPDIPRAAPAAVVERTGSAASAPARVLQPQSAGMPNPAVPPRALAIARAAEARAVSTAGIAVSVAAPRAAAVPSPAAPSRAARLGEAPRTGGTRRTIKGKRLEFGT